MTTQREDVLHFISLSLSLSLAFSISLCCVVPSPKPIILFFIDSPFPQILLPLLIFFAEYFTTLHCILNQCHVQERQAFPFHCLLIRPSLHLSLFLSLNPSGGPPADERAHSAGPPVESADGPPGQGQGDPEQALGQSLHLRQGDSLDDIEWGQGSRPRRMRFIECNRTYTRVLSSPPCSGL
jgi:hypothetical protein